MTAALEAGVLQCVNARHYEVTLEHVLLALLDDADSYLAFIVSHYDLNPSQLRATLTRSLEDLRVGNAGKPVFSPTMLECMQDAYVVGSMDYGWNKVRSGTMFLRLVHQPSRYTTYEEAKGEMLQRLQGEILEKAKRKWLEELKGRTHLDVRL